MVTEVASVVTAELVDTCDGRGVAETTCRTNCRTQSSVMALGVTTRAAGRHTSGQEAVDAELLS